MVFLMKHNPLSNAGDGRTTARGEYNPPQGYVPKLTRIGDAARKIYIADGARYSTTSVRPDYDINYDGSFGGAYSDQGAWSTFSRSWDRARAPGNGGSGFDARLYAFRHGSTKHGASADAYRFNAAFFDGHVETLGDLQGADPSLWLPKGTSVTLGGGQTHPDVTRLYGNGGGTLVVAY